MENLQEDSNSESVKEANIFIQGDFVNWLNNKIEKQEGQYFSFLSKDEATKLAHYILASVNQGKE